MRGAFEVSREIVLTLCERVGMSSTQGLSWMKQSTMRIVSHSRNS
jgi:hypothetical protein